LIVQATRQSGLQFQVTNPDFQQTGISSIRYFVEPFLSTATVNASDGGQPGLQAVPISFDGPATLEGWNLSVRPAFQPLLLAAGVLTDIHPYINPSQARASVIVTRSSAGYHSLHVTNPDGQDECLE